MGMCTRLIKTGAELPNEIDQIVQLRRVFFVPNETASHNQECPGMDIYFMFLVLKIFFRQICRFMFWFHLIASLAGSLTM